MSLASMHVAAHKLSTVSLYISDHEERPQSVSQTIEELQLHLVQRLLAS